MFCVVLTHFRREKVFSCTHKSILLTYETNSCPGWWRPREIWISRHFSVLFCPGNLQATATRRSDLLSRPLLLFYFAHDQNTFTFQTFSLLWDQAGAEKFPLTKADTFPSKEPPSYFLSALLLVKLAILPDSLIVLWVVRWQPTV